MRAIDADALKREGWHMTRTVRVDKDTMEMQTRKPTDFPTIDPYDWIPVTERLPEEPFGCLVTVCDTDPVTLEDFENILPYFVGYDGKQWNDYEGEQCPFEVLAWMPLPEPYKGGQE